MPKPGAQDVGARPPSAVAAMMDWPVQPLGDALAAVVPGLVVEVLPSIDSTNTELMRRARAGQTRPCLLVAERQTAGRGRMGRTWHSDAASLPDGPAPATAPVPSLTFSLGLALAPASWSGLSLAVGVAVARSLHPRIGLKWPNDLWLDGRKLAGILIETATTAQQRHTVIGVGINIVARDGTGLSTPPACLQELLPGIDAPAVLQRVVPDLVRSVVLFETQGFAPFQDAFAQRDVLSAQEVTLSDGSGGTARGVDETGGLLVHTSSGMKTVTSAEVSVRPSGARPGTPS
jgi:BirA family transcriptional regulator, biotin operon repressor / biotin---[acetyl-CoA-carboxylase] ligase